MMIIDMYCNTKGLCGKPECICYNCVKDCGRCDGCGDYNYVGDCNNYVSSEQLNKKPNIFERILNKIFK